MHLTFTRKEVLALALTCAAKPAGVVPYTGPAWEKVLGKSAKERRERGLELVGDQGVYFMSNEPDQQRLEGKDSYPVAHSRECDPEKNDFDTWRHNKGASFGADDGVVFIKIQDILIWLSRNMKKRIIAIDITPKSYRLL